MIQDRLDRLDEADRVRQLRMEIESDRVLPTTVDEELVGVSDRLERVGAWTSNMARCTSPRFPGRA